MKESWRSRFERFLCNIFPAYRGTGARVTYIAADYYEVHIKLPLNWRTRNYVGTTFGGSLYAAVDPMFMLMLIKILGPDYIVWDKAASIQFKRPGKTTLYAYFKIEHHQIEEILDALVDAPFVNYTFHIDLVDNEGRIHSSVEKLLYIKKKKEPAES